MEYEEVEVNSERWFDLTPLLNEEFRDIKGYKGLYQVSNYGRIKSLERTIIRKNGRGYYQREHIMKQFLRKGYLRVTLIKQNKAERKTSHKIVVQTFIGEYNNNLQINHINGIKTNNKIYNLEIVTPRENMLHSYKFLNRNKRMKSIQKLDNNMNIVEEFNCIADACRKYGYKDCTICNACRFKNKRYGYYWKYKEE